MTTIALFGAAGKIGTRIAREQAIDLASVTGCGPGAGSRLLTWQQRGSR